jgi:S-adenosylmethionine hydrolase
VTLLTDFGTADYFVAAMKAQILSINPGAQIVDITHDIPPQDIESAAFTLLAVCETFPAGTIHVAVVDPGVGSLRKPIAIETGGMFFVGPDNGIFSYVLERSDKPWKAVHLANEKYFSRSVSATFNGRDIFAPVAAALSKGIASTELGPRLTDLVRLAPLKPELRAGKVIGRIIHIDHFGNCVTNITQHELTPRMISAGATLKVKGTSIRSFKSYFAEEAKGQEKIFAVWGSAGFLEIAAQDDSAAKLLKLKRGDSVAIESQVSLMSDKL